MNKPITKPDKTPFERMTELTRRLVAVPKSEVSPTRKPKKRRNRRRS